MKKIYLAIMALLFITNISSFGQSYAKNKTSPSTQNGVVLASAKYQAVVTFEDTKGIYYNGISEKAFVDAAISFTDDRVLQDIFKPYMSTIYYYHLNNLSATEVFNSDKGIAFTNMANKLKGKDLGESFQGKRKIPWWVKILIKILIEIIF